MGFLDRLFNIPTASKAEPILQLNSSEDLQNVMRKSSEQPMLIFKHSRACWTSQIMRREIEALREEFKGQLFEIVVQNARSVSNEISTTLGIRHETPQAIVLIDQKVIKHRSHGAINRNELSNLLRQSESGDS